MENFEDEQKQKAIEKALGEPFMPNFQEPILKMRTHLLIGGVIGLAAVLLNIQINSASPIFGIVFNGLTEVKIYCGLLFVNLYLFVHFFWASLDYFLEWKLRLTGNKVIFQSGGFYHHPDKDTPVDPRQSTLYTWWRESSKDMIACGSKLDEVQKALDILTSNITDELANGQAAELVDYQKELSEIRMNFSKIRETLSKTETLIESKRVNASLYRFDNSYKFFQKTQSRRWLVMEWFIPVVVGISAVGVLSYKVTQILW